MLWTVVVLLLILWLLGFTMHVAGGLIHILLVIALVVVVFRLLSGRRRGWRRGRGSQAPGTAGIREASCFRGARKSRGCMDVYLVPIGRERYELYCEVPDEPEESVVDPPSDGFIHRMKQRFFTMLAEAEQERRRGHA